MRTQSKKIKQYDSFKMRGYLEFVLRDSRTGEIVQKGQRHNVVTAAGRGYALGRVVSSSNTSLLTAIAVGSTTTAPTSNDTGLGAWATAKTFNVGTTLTTATNTACTFSAAASWASDQTWTNSSQIGEFALILGTTSNAYTGFNHITTGSFINFGTSNTLAVTITITN
jgi:hypothetical protein